MRKTIHAATLALMASQMGGTLAARAADLSLPPLYQPEASPMVEFGSGWYLRGDVGYVNFGSPGTAVIQPNPFTGVTNATGQQILNDTSSHFGLLGATAGVGYQFNNWYRMDATFDWRQPINNGAESQASCPGPGYNMSTTCLRSDTTKIQNWTGLLNAYGDLGNWFGLTPYVGAGVGITQLHAVAGEKWMWNNGTPWGNSGPNNLCPAGADPLTGASYCYSLGYPGNVGPAQTRNNFSWALMAGVSYDVAPHVKIDIGYRYLNMGVLDATNPGGVVIHHTVDSQEVRAGLRFTPDL
jgi:opacity protein-like surface antigen